MASTGVASSWMMAVAYSDQTNNGILNQVMPWRRSVCVVTRKFMPGEDRTEPKQEGSDNGGG